MSLGVLNKVLIISWLITGFRLNVRERERFVFLKEQKA